MPRNELKTTFRESEIGQEREAPRAGRLIVCSKWREGRLAPLARSRVTEIGPGNFDVREITA